jgi:hypothetical protein
MKMYCDPLPLFIVTLYYHSLMDLNRYNNSSRHYSPLTMQSYPLQLYFWDNKICLNFQMRLAKDGGAPQGWTRVCGIGPPYHRQILIRFLAGRGTQVIRNVEASRHLSCMAVQPIHLAGRDRPPSQASGMRRD